MWRLLVRASLALATTALAITALLLLLPPSIGRSLLGDTWASARPLVLPAGLVATSGGVMAGALAGLRSRRAASSSLRVRVQTAPILLVVPLVGALAWGARGYLWGAFAAAVAATGLWWGSLATVLRSPSPP